MNGARQADRGAETNISDAVQSWVWVPTTYSYLNVPFYDSTYGSITTVTTTKKHSLTYGPSEASLLFVLIVNLGEAHQRHACLHG